jgi:hypothetical protein
VLSCGAIDECIGWFLGTTGYACYYGDGYYEWQCISECDATITITCDWGIIGQC